MNFYILCIIKIKILRLERHLLCVVQKTKLSGNLKLVRVIMQKRFDFVEIVFVQMGNIKHKEGHKDDTKKDSEFVMSRSTKLNRLHNEKNFLQDDLFSNIILAQISYRDFLSIFCTCKTWMRLLDKEENWREIALKKFGISSKESIMKIKEETNQSWREISNMKYYLDYLPKAYLDCPQKNIKNRMSKKKERNYY